MLYRFDVPLFFANAELFVEPMLDAIAGADDPISWVDRGRRADHRRRHDRLPRFSAEMLDDLRSQGIELAFAELKGPVKDRLRRYGLYDRIGDDRFFPTLGTAIDGYLADDRHATGSTGATPTPTTPSSDAGPDTVGHQPHRPATRRRPCGPS